jgi:thiamine biosynthesis lipoprotein
MKQTQLIMGMPITVEIADDAPEKIFADVFDYFTYIDKKFSTYKSDSEMMRINRGEIPESEWSDDMRIVLMLSEETKQRTGGFFDIRRPDGSIDPSGLVKGWAIYKAAQLIEAAGFKNFYIDAGGDIQTSGMNAEGKPWSVGIKNPFNQNEIVKTVYLGKNNAVATSGTYIRGEHIYNPKTGAKANEIVSLTVIGQNIYEADRFATAAFAMGAAGIQFIESLREISGFEGYMINKDGVATMTNGFEKYCKP